MSRKLAARALFILSIPFAICSTGWAASAAAQVAPKAGAKIEFMPEGQILPGMRGVALTVFEGTKPEPMQLEVLGIEKNATGPKGDLILVRLLGSKPEYTGVVA
ncbi:MAG TPA: SpoIVB peptidase S55, partial [Terriglobales bacterium]|nr:SpoIVB peptidase S55 [Terriglobales bacterium]